MIFLTRIKPQPPQFAQGIRLAIYQNDGGPVGNLEAIAYYLSKMEEAVKAAKQFGAQLISFPELYLTGYAVSPTKVHQLAQTGDSQTLEQVAQMAKDYQIALICPYPEKAIVNGETHYFDSIALWDGNGKLLKNYRKTHLWGPDEGKI